MSSSGPMARDCMVQQVPIELSKSNDVFRGPVAWRALALAAIRGAHDLDPGHGIAFLSDNGQRRTHPFQKARETTFGHPLDRGWISPGARVLPPQAPLGILNGLRRYGQGNLVAGCRKIVFCENVLNVHFERLVLDTMPSVFDGGRLKAGMGEFPASSHSLIQGRIQPRGEASDSPVSWISNGRNWRPRRTTASPLGERLWRSDNWSGAFGLSTRVGLGSNSCHRPVTISSMPTSGWRS